MKNFQKSFSLKTYFLVVIALSWSFQIAYVLWAETPFMRYALSSLPMIMVAVTTYIAGRYIFRDGFSTAGWNWSKSKHYSAVFSLAIFVWVVPTIVELILGMRSISKYAIAYAYIWTVTQSLAVVTVYHTAFDEIRDAIASSIGYGFLVEIWQMLTLTVLGGLLLWKGNWKQLTLKKI